MESRDEITRTRRSLALSLSLALGGLLAGSAFAASPEEVRYEPFPIASLWGQPVVAARLGRFSVAENRASGSPRSIELAFVRIPATAAKPGAPILWLSGGPGASATADLQTPALELFLELRRLADVIVLDQRGTGMSVPRLDCPGKIRLPLEVATDRQHALEALERSARSCAEKWRAEGVDLSAYNIRESSEDIEDLRRALGVPKLRILAGSWGTHLALAAIRTHEATIERAALIGVVGPDHIVGSPADVESRLARVAAIAHGDSGVARALPDVLESARRQIDRLRREPRTVQLPASDGGTIAVAVGSYELAWYLRSLLTSPDTISHVPAFLAALEAGDFRELAVIAFHWRSAPAPPASVFAARCASGGSPARLERVERESRLAMLGETTTYADERVCRAFGVGPLPDSFRSPVESRIPALFVSGTLDGDTPEENAIEVSRGFPNAERLVIDGAPHALLGFADKTSRAAILRFFEGRSLREARVALAPIPFERPESATGASLRLAASSPFPAAP